MTLTLLIILGSLVGVALVTWGLWYIFSPHAPRRMRRHVEFSTELRNDQGFVGVDMAAARFIGVEGYAMTDLRPAGKIVIEGCKPLDAVAVMGFISAGARVRVSRYENAQLYVEEV